MSLQTVLDSLSGTRRAGSGWKALCPAHADFAPSLAIDPGEGGRVLLRCHAGCSIDAIMQAAGLDWADVIGDGTPADTPRGDSSGKQIDWALRDAVYQRLLSELELTDEDWKALKARGLSTTHIYTAGYASVTMPLVAQVAAGLYADHGERLYEVPGFEEVHGKPRLSMPDGLLIPVRSPTGTVEGIQVRTGDADKKYIWLSTPPLAPSGSPCHVPIVTKKTPLDGPVRITEGPLKADVAQALTGQRTIGIGGVTTWKAALPVLAHLGVIEVELAFDMDRDVKEGVREAMNGLGAELLSRGYTVTVASWDAAHKGLDDAIKAGAEIRSEPFKPSEVPVAKPSKTAAKAPEKPRPKPSEAVVLNMAEVEERDVEWLWDGWIPLGALTILDGDPGEGKSTLTASLVAAVTRGRPMPRQIEMVMGPALIVSSEDDPSTTIRPRLRLAGADLRKVTYWKGLQSATDRAVEMPLFPDHTEILRDLIQRTGARVVVIDPLFAHINDQFDTHKDQSVRTVLSRLSQVAQDTNAAIFAVRHLNKRSDEKVSIYRGSGSIGVIGQARSGMAFVSDREDPARRHLFHIKSNLAAKQKPLVALVTQVEGMPVLAWEGDSDKTWGDLTESSRSKDGTAREWAAREQWLLTQLLGGPVATEELVRKGADYGWSADQLDRTKKRLGIKSKKDGDKWYWLPPADPKLLRDDGKGIAGQGTPEGAANGRPTH